VIGNIRNRHPGGNDAKPPIEGSKLAQKRLQRRLTKPPFLWTGRILERLRGLGFEGAGGRTTDRTSGRSPGRLEPRPGTSSCIRQSKLPIIAWTFDLAERLTGTGVTANTLHPVSLMPTKMVLEAGWQTMSSVEEGLKATLRLVIDPALENVTGEYFDGLRPANSQCSGLRPDGAAATGGAFTGTGFIEIMSCPRNNMPWKFILLFENGPACFQGSRCAPGDLRAQPLHHRQSSSGAHRGVDGRL
jgi:hypothetical protein